MRRWEVGPDFGLASLRLVEGDEPRPGPQEVVLQVLATSLNFRDLLVVQGRYDPRLPRPFVPLSDGVGLVEAVGSEVDSVQVGQRVVGLFAPRWRAGHQNRETLRFTLGAPGPGMLAERVVLPAWAVAPVPEHLTDEEAATLPCAALTAWTAVVEEGRVRAGDRVLVLGTGGVSTFALQFAVMHGAQVAVTSSQAGKLERARALGATFGVDYRAEPRWGRVVRQWAGEGVDIVVEVGGAGTLAESLRAVRAGGTVALIGVLAGGEGTTSLLPVLMNHVRVQGILVGHRQGFEAMARAIEVHRMRPVVDRVFPFEQAPAAFEYLEAARHVGKVCVRVAEANA